MSLQLSVAVRNAMLDALETITGTSAKLAMMTGAQPANCAAAETGTRVATLPLPSDYFADAASGTKAKSGTWEDTSADAAGTAGYWRLYDSAGTTCHAQGSITATGGGGQLTLDNPVLAAGQDVVVTSFTLTGPNA